MQTTTTAKRRRAVLGLLTATILISGLVGCEYQSDKTYATVDVDTWVFDPEGTPETWIDVHVTNKTGSAIRAEVDVDDLMIEGPIVLNIPAGQTKFYTFDDVCSACSDVDVWVKITAAGGGPALEWHHFDNVEWDYDE